MGSFCSLYIGDKEFSWKSVVPDPVCVLFEPKDYAFADRDYEFDGEMWGGPEHLFVSTCGAARSRLEKIGVSIGLLRELHFFGYAFDFEDFAYSLRYRCESYLKQREKLSPKDLDAMVRRLLRKFVPLTQDQEFQRVLEHQKVSGTRDDYLEYMRSKLSEARAQQKGTDTSQVSEFDMMGFSRQRLMDMIERDPYLVEESGWPYSYGIGAPDLEILYDICMPIFASDQRVPIEFEFTELAPSYEQLEPHEVAAWLLDGQQDLARKSDLMGAAYGRATGSESWAAQDQSAPRVHKKVLSDEVPVTDAALRHHRNVSKKEKGDELEALATSIFEEQFEVQRNIRHSDQEIDLVVTNRLDDPFWMSLQSPVLLVECRNHAKRVGAKQIRDFEVKLRNFSGVCSLGIVISSSGFTRECRTVALRASRESYRILLVSYSDIRDKVSQGLTTSRWLEGILVNQV